MSLHIIARFHARPGKERAVADAIGAVSGPTRAEAGCLDYQVFRSTRDPALFFIHSRWQGEAAFDQHGELPHTVRFLAAVEPLIDHPLEVTRVMRII